MTLIVHNQPPLPRRVTIVGVGLIGGSFALAMRRAVPDICLTGVDRDEINLATARQMGVLDQVQTDVASAVKEAQLIVLAVPVRQLSSVLTQIAAHLPVGAVVTDVGSTKSSVLEVAQATMGTSLARFVPGHPIAGAEQSGVRAARADLFQGCSVVLTPTPECDEQARGVVQQCWEACGAKVELMTAESHDAIFGVVSHLPHLLSFALVHDIATRADAPILFRFAAGGFRDFTRIAASSPEMWRDISLANRSVLLLEIQRYREQLDYLTQLLLQEDESGLESFFKVARQARRDWNDTP